MTYLLNSVLLILLVCVFVGCGSNKQSKPLDKCATTITLNSYPKLVDPTQICSEWLYRYLVSREYALQFSTPDFKEYLIGEGSAQLEVLDPSFQFGKVSVELSLESDPLVTQQTIQCAGNLMLDREEGEIFNPPGLKRPLPTRTEYYWMASYRVALDLVWTEEWYKAEHLTLIKENEEFSATTFTQEEESHRKELEMTTKTFDRFWEGCEPFDGLTDLPGSVTLYCESTGDTSIEQIEESVTTVSNITLFELFVVDRDGRLRIYYPIEIAKFNSRNSYVQDFGEENTDISVEVEVHKLGFKYPVLAIRHSKDKNSYSENCDSSESVVFVEYLLFREDRFESIFKTKTYEMIESGCNVDQDLTRWSESSITFEQVPKAPAELIVEVTDSDREHLIGEVTIFRFNGDVYEEVKNNRQRGR